MDSEKLLATYSLLAAIKEGEENKASDSLLNVFIPLVKKAMKEYPNQRKRMNASFFFGWGY